MTNNELKAEIIKRFDIPASVVESFSESVYKNLQMGYAVNGWDGVKKILTHESEMMNQVMCEFLQSAADNDWIRAGMLIDRAYCIGLLQQ